MTIGSSTIRAAKESTIPRASDVASGLVLQGVIEHEWRSAGKADLVAVLRQRPNILQDKSLLLNLAIREYQQRRTKTEIEDLEDYCERFREFGGSIERSVFRQLDVQRVVDDCLNPSGLAEPVWPVVGERFGSFHVLEQLGFGAIARVYLCLQCDLGNRQVVVKATPHASIEASILGKLDHDGITPIHSTGYVEESELYFLCMPYAGRSTLTDLIDLAFAAGCPKACHVRIAANRWGTNGANYHRPWYRRCTPFIDRTYVDCALDIAIDVANALDYAHSQRILHGDLKPSNVLLTPEGRPLLLDFNLSQDFTNELRRCGGTLQYMAPEYLRRVAEADARNVDTKFHPAPDVFSFGVLLYEMLYGVKPVQPPRNQCEIKLIAISLIEQYRDGIAVPRCSKTVVSSGLESLIKSCLAFDPNQRPPSMALVRDRLKAERRWLASSLRRSRANPLATVAIGIFGLVLATAAALYLALQPPRHVSAFAAGVEAEKSGDLPAAIADFDEALSFDPTFQQARFARGRAYLRADNLDFAMKDFWLLARAGDSKAMAMLAYCFNLQNVKVAAVAWYEKAIDHGQSSAAIHNNLGACYLVTQTHLTREEQLSEAERHLQRALTRDGESKAIQLNNVRLAATKAEINPSYNPSHVWQIAFRLLHEKPEDQLVGLHVSRWFRCLRRYLDSTGAEQLPDTPGITPAAWQAFEEASRHHSAADATVPLENASKRGALPVLERGYFLEPFTFEFQR